MIRSDRRFSFACSSAELWGRIEQTGDYRRWWPWLRQFDGDGLVEGARWSCLVQPPLPYAVRFTVDLSAVEPGRRAAATITGDIAGTAELTIVERGPARCEARMLSDLGPSSPLLRTIAAVARPVVTWGHDWVLDQGARQFRANASLAA